MESISQRVVGQTSIPKISSGGQMSTYKISTGGQMSRSHFHLGANAHLYFFHWGQMSWGANVWRPNGSY